MADFSFPNFNLPGYPYANLPDQAIASMQLPQGLLSYGRFNGTGVSGPAAGGGAGGAPLPPGWRPGDPLPPGWAPNMQVPAPPLTPGMQVPGLPPGQSPFTPGLPNVPPAGSSGGLLGLPVAPNTGIAPAGAGGAPAPTAGGGAAPASGAVQKPSLDTQNKAAVVSPASVAAPDGGSFATSAVMNGPLAGQLQKALAYGDGRSKFAQAVLAQSGPQSLTTGDFNKAAAVDPRLALTLLGMGGGGYQQAVAQANGWTPEQFAQFANGTLYNAPGAQNNAGLSAANLALLRSLGIA